MISCLPTPGYCLLAGIMFAGSLNPEVKEHWRSAIGAVLWMDAYLQQPSWSSGAHGWNSCTPRISSVRTLSLWLLLGTFQAPCHVPFHVQVHGFRINLWREHTNAIFPSYYEPASLQ